MVPPTLQTILELGIAVIVGALLSVFYFVGLWMTVRAVPGSRKPAMLLVGSFAARTAVVLVGFGLIMSRSLNDLAAALVVFTIVRAVIVNRIGANGSMPLATGQGGRHE